MRNVVLLFGLWAILVFSGMAFVQTDDQDSKNNRVAGKKFLNNIVGDWEEYLNVVPLKVSKAIIRSSKFGDYELWNAKGFYLVVKISSESPDGKLVSFGNPEYKGAVDVQKGKSAVVDSGEKLDLGYLFSPFESVSVLGNLSIPRLIRSGDLQVDDYNYENGIHRVVLISQDESATNGADRVELTFDDQYLPLPRSKAVNLPAQNADNFAEFLEFKNLNGDWLPTKRKSITNHDGKELVSNIMPIEYFPDEKLDTAQCFFEYYGLARPDGIVADFGKKSNFGFWMTVGVAIVSGVGVLGYFYRKRR